MSSLVDRIPQIGRWFAGAAAIALLSASCLAADKYQKPTQVRLTSAGRKWVERTLKHLSLEEKVGQMLQVRYFMDFQNVESDASRRMRSDLETYHIGSVTLTVHTDGTVLLKDLPFEIGEVANQLQRDSKLPLLISADLERGLVSRSNDVPSFPDAMAFGAVGKPEYAERFGAITADESRSVGIEWNLFPVADVNSNPSNPIINTRSFGEDPDAVGSLVAAYIRGARAHGMASAAKHFPGHGDTGTDSHLGVPMVTGDLARLRAVEMRPFQMAIAAGVESVMVAHLGVPALEPDAHKVATVSARVIGDTLRGQLGFKGIVITDALEMRGLTNLYPPGNPSPTARAAVDAVKAGDDVILWPTDLAGAFHAIVAAVRSGEIPESRIDDSVRKVLELKASLDLHRAKLVDLENIPRAVAKPDAMEFAQRVADEAVTLVRDNGQVLPLRRATSSNEKDGPYQPIAAPSGKLVILIMKDAVADESGRAFRQALQDRSPDATFFVVDETIATPMAQRIVAAVNAAEKVVVLTYVVPTAGKQVVLNGRSTNTVSLPPDSDTLLRRVLDAAAARTALIAMGSPYIASAYPQVQTYICTYSSAASSDLSAVKTLFGELRPTGRLPVTIPGIAERGFSLAPAR